MELSEFKINYNNNELFYKFNTNDAALNQIVITFDQNIYKENNNLNEGEVNLTFKNESDILNLISIFFQNIVKQKRIDPNVKFVFVINANNKEVDSNLARQIINAAQLKNYEFKEVTNKEQLLNQPNQEPPKSNEQIIEQQKDLIATGTTQISKQDINNETKNYIEVDGKIYNDNDSLSIAEKKQILLQEWLNDPLKKASIINLSKEQLDVELTKVVTLNQKQYDLSSPTQEKSNDQLASTSNGIAAQTDGKVNEELGIVQNGVYTSNQYTAVEQTKDNGVKVITPTTTNQTITGNTSNQGISTSSTTTASGTFNGNLENQEYNISNENEEIEQREVENIYYLDDSNNVYNSKGEVIGVLGPQTGYYIDVNNNLVKENQVLGSVENLRDMKQEKEKHNVKTRVLEHKPDGYISFMLISIVLSIIFLIYIVVTLI